MLGIGVTHRVLIFGQRAAVSLLNCSVTPGFMDVNVARFLVRLMTEPEFSFLGITIDSTQSRGGD